LRADAGGASNELVPVAGSQQLRWAVLPGYELVADDPVRGVAVFLAEVFDELLRVLEGLRVVAVTVHTDLYRDPVQRIRATSSVPATGRVKVRLDDLFIVYLIVPGSATRVATSLQPGMSISIRPAAGVCRLVDVNVATAVGTGRDDSAIIGYKVLTDLHH